MAWHVQITGDVLCLMDGDRMMAVCGHDGEKAEELVRRLNGGCSDIEHAVRAALREASAVARSHSGCDPGFRCMTKCGSTIAAAIEALAG